MGVLSGDREAMITVETLAAEDLDLGVGSIQKTHPNGGVMNAHQVSLSTLSVAGPSGLSYSESYQSPILSSGSSYGKVVTINGASPGDFVMASHDGLGDDDIIVSAHVQSVNTVRVVFANISGEQVVGHSGILKVMVFKVR